MFQLIKKYIKPLLSLQIIALCIIVINILFTVYQPILMQRLIDSYNTETLSAKEISYLGSLFLLLLIGGGLTGALRDSVIFKIKNLLQFRLRNDIHQQNLNLRSYQPTGKIISLLYNDVEALTGLLNQAFIAMFTDCLTIVATAVVLYFMNWKLATVSLIFIPIYFFLYYNSKKKVYQLNVAYKKQYENMTETLQLGLKQKWTAIRFNRQKYSSALFCREQILLVRILKKLFARELLLGIISNFLSGFFPLLLLVIGGFLLIYGEITLGTLVAFSTYIVKLLQPVSRLSQLNVGVQSAIASAERILNFFNLNDVWNGTNIEGFMENGIYVKNVSFSYNNLTPILDDISFEIKKNQMLGIVGESGSGKTTIVKLLTGEVIPTKGEIYYGDKRLHDLNKNYFYKNIAVVTQEELLTTGTIFDNIAFGNKNATLDEVVNISKKVGLHDYISSLPEKYNTNIISGKYDLSVGQKQRLAIARALLHNAPVLILDELTSALDAETESLILDLLNELKGKRTIIIIAHKFQTVIHADHILVVQNGQIVEQGSHADLMSYSSTYSNSYMKQIDFLQNEVPEPSYK
ncbi:ABC transporter ATP-binding protein [Paenibacillus sp. CMAA1739]|uniref:ABC transporter ATP-binding protein n=1 Tax=Paenibacillus ottowii TaxID=2315729 RepID=UPI0027301674|nr:MULTISPECIES: ABC transporter ATP-binding protein [Paenibacillus]MDP1510521.1 ABC transporter ATP-binding protein [Paenibacillus ottowii]MEC4565935.1 ABC transporter ATP-binding protein [Paenibacillus sp. CMAA1739]